MKKDKKKKRIRKRMDQIAAGERKPGNAGSPNIPKPFRAEKKVTIQDYSDYLDEQADKPEDLLVGPIDIEDEDEEGISSKEAADIIEVLLSPEMDALMEEDKKEKKGEE